MIALLAALIERALGYPPRLVDTIGHPVMWMGWLIEKGEALANRPADAFATRRAAGVLMLGAVLAIVLVVSLWVSTMLDRFPYGWLLEAVLASTLIAQKGLRDAVLAVARALDREGVPAGRAAVAHIVGRDTAQLDEAEISCAAIETLAENASDGVVAPLLYLALFGLPGIALYKAVNTADSMIGHRSERYLAFGWAAARLDDLVNLIPARLTALLFAGAARFLPGADAGAAWRTARRDAKKHASPNAGWPEAAMAGALGFGLGGRRAYAGRVLDLPRMGEGRRDLRARDIALAIRLYDLSLYGVWGVLAVLAALRIAA